MHSGELSTVDDIDGKAEAPRHGTQQQGTCWKDRYSNAFCAAHTFAVD